MLQERSVWRASEEEVELGLAVVPALPRQDAVPAIVAIFRSGLQRVTCPYFHSADGTCGALLEQCLEDRVAIAEYCVKGSLCLPLCPYDKQTAPLR
jgi:hypothetical protein